MVDRFGLGLVFFQALRFYPVSNIPLVLRTHIYLTEKDKWLKSEILEISRISGANWTGMKFPIIVLPFGGLIGVTKSQIERSIS